MLCMDSGAKTCTGFSNLRLGARAHSDSIPRHGGSDCDDGASLARNAIGYKVVRINIKFQSSLHIMNTWTQYCQYQQLPTERAGIRCTNNKSF
jgi:hypothetical protein